MIWGTIVGDIYCNICMFACDKGMKRVIIQESFFVELC